MKQTLLFASIILGSSFVLADTVTTDNLKGTYIFTERGDVGDQTLVGLGSITLDGKGNATCAERIKAEGQNLTTTCTGSYTINTDGSASVKLLHTVTPGITETATDSNAPTDPQTITVNYRILMIGSSGQMKGIRTDNGASVIADLSAVRAFSQAPTLLSLKGSYVFTQQGLVQNNQLITGLGVMTLDGNGNVACTEALQFPGASVVSKCSGKYYINADGSGSIEILYDDAFAPDGGLENTPQISAAKFAFYQVNSGKQLKGIRAENGVFLIAAFEKY